jgi:hypothetical protein
LIVLYICHKEGFGIAKNEGRILNPFQFNVIAIIFILGVLPVGVAIVSNAGSSSNETFESTMPTTPGLIGEYLNDSYWIDNGGTNYTQFYSSQGWDDGIQSRSDCAYVKDGYCSNPALQDGFLSYYGFEFDLPTTSTRLEQTHEQVSKGNGYSGSSGSKEFGFHLESKFFDNIEEGESIDGLKIWLVDEDIISCDHQLIDYAEIEFEGSLSFHYDNSTVIFDNYQFKESNKFQYSKFDINNGGFDLVCSYGFVLDFDLSGFETLALSQFNGNQWNETSISIEFDNFERDDGLDFANTGLPFAGDGYFNFGMEYKSVNPQEVGFFIKTGTLLLSVVTAGIALASTPYWDPFKNFFKGMV